VRGDWFAENDTPNGTSRGPGARVRRDDACADVDDEAGRAHQHLTRKPDRPVADAGDAPDITASPEAG
jgi:hypothetical protein